MDKHENAIVLAVLSSAMSGVLQAGENPRQGQAEQAATVEAGDYSGRSPYHSVKTVYSDCQRRGVVWSGGVAQRGPDRIRPRPVRSRWQGADEKQIFCMGGDPFSRKRVADQPWIR